MTPDAFIFFLWCLTSGGLAGLVKPMWLSITLLIAAIIFNGLMARFVMFPP